MQYVNRAKHLVFVPLNTGDRLHLAPGEKSRELEPFETEGNDRLNLLVKKGAIAPVETKERAKPTDAPAAAEPAKPSDGGAAAEPAKADPEKR